VKFSPPLVEGRLIERPNRFLGLVNLDGSVVKAWIHDPGRMRELLYPGAPVWLAAAPPGRKTTHTAMLTRIGRSFVSLYSSLPNQLVADALGEDRLPELSGSLEVDREVTDGNSRFDFRLATHPPTWLEVKSVTLVENGTALFPDAPTVRGRRHLLHLARLARAGQKAVVLFVVQRSDAHRVMSHRQRDPAFADALVEAIKSGVRILARRCRVSPESIQLGDAIPVVPG
jgi:sugar fermentation stimulation protein A